MLPYTLFYFLAALPSPQHASGVPAPTTSTAVELPAVPVELTAFPCGDQVELRWRHDSLPESGFDVYRRPSTSPVYVSVGTTGPAQTSFLDTGLPPGVFFYRVAARAGGLESPHSDPVQVKFPNSAPVITTDLPASISLDFDMTVRFHVTVTDPDGDAVDLQLLNPPLGVIFDPVRQARGSATVEGRWMLGQPVAEARAAGLRVHVRGAEDGRRPAHVGLRRSARRTLSAHRRRHR